MNAVMDKVKVGLKYRSRAPDKLLIQQTEDELCARLLEFGYEPTNLHSDLGELKKKRFKGKHEKYINYLTDTTELLKRLNEVNKDIVVNDGYLQIHLNAPIEKLELGEFYLQAGVSEPGTLAIKFAKLDPKTQKLEQSQAKLEAPSYEKCATVEFFKEFRARAVFAGDCLFRLCYVKDKTGKVTKLETKQLFKRNNKQREVKGRSEPINLAEAPKTVYDMEQALRNCIRDGLKRETTLPGKDHLSFARKLGYSEKEVMHFDKRNEPAESIIKDMVQTFPLRPFIEIIHILEQMGRNDIIEDCRRYTRVSKRLGKSQSLDHDYKGRTLSSPADYIGRKNPVESSEFSVENRLLPEVPNPPYPSIGGAVGGQETDDSPTSDDEAQTLAKTLIPSNIDSNPSYPPLHTELTNLTISSGDTLDSLDDPKRHMQPEGDLSLTTDVE